MSEQYDQWNEWAASAQGGDKRAYHALLKDIAPFIYKVVTPKLSNPSWADDVVQDVLLSVHKSLHTYSADKAFKPWLSAIIEFRRTDYLRKHYRKRDNQQTSIDNAVFSDEFVTKPSVTGELKDIEAALQRFTDKQRTLFTMMRIEGYTAKEVAEKMDMTESAVKVSVHRMTKDLEAILEPQVHLNTGTKS